MPTPSAGVDPAPAAIQVETLRDSLYVLRGGGRTVQIGGVTLPSAGNTLAFVTARGVILVDTKLPGCGQPILDALRQVTDRPVTTIVNTHTHVDHVGGNVDFPATVEVIAHERTAALMKEMRPVTGGGAQPHIFRDSDGRGLPTRTFENRMTLGAGAERVELHYFGPAHTGGDAWVLFPEQRVLHTGDAFAHKVVPLVDVSNGGSGVLYPQTIARAVVELTDVDTVISGHYPTALTMTDLATYAAFTRAFVETVQAAKRAGRTIDDTVAAWSLPERFVDEGYTQMTHLRPLRPDVEAVWNETA